MWSGIIRCCCLSLLVLLCGAVAGAQEFRVVTTIHNMTEGQSRGRRELGRNLTIFHAGEAYDVVDEVNEITIYQPARRQFTIFNIRRMLATTISFERIHEIQTHMDRQTQDWILYLLNKGDDRSLQEARTLQFQLAPEFEEQFDEKQKVLTMKSDEYSYTVQSDAVAAKKPRLVSGYIEYTNWMAQLNPLMHPEAMFPGPRLKVNKVLQSRGLLPVKVSRIRNIAGQPHLQARHEFKWKLTRRDQRSIRAWKQHLQSDEMKWVEFADFQEKVAPPIAQR